MHSKANINVSVSGFNSPYQGINGPHTLKLTRAELLWAVISVGSKSLQDASSGGFLRIGQHIGNSLLVLTNIAIVNGDLSLHPIFFTMDQSERNIVTYKLGMALTKYLASELLDIAWLEHADRLIADGTIKLGAGSRKRGDLVGKDLSGDWHAFEAKGRANSPSPNTISDAKIQVRNIVQIGSSAPRTNCVSLIRTDLTPISVILEDPQSNESEGVKYSISEEKFLITYYSHLVELLRSSKTKIRTFSNVEYRTLTLNTAGLEYGFGLPVEIYQSPGIARLFVKEHLQHSKQKSDDLELNYHIGKDGIVAFFNPLIDE